MRFLGLNFRWAWRLRIARVAVVGWVLLTMAFHRVGADPAPAPTNGAPAFAVGLPQGVKAVWSADQAWREATPTRERISLNGLWRWQPDTGTEATVPQGGWGWFKVPGSWPGITDYMQKDSQSVRFHPAWAGIRLRDLTAAWYEREFEVPPAWTGRRILVRFEYLNSHARVWVDDRPAGEVLFPAGDLDLTAHCRPGARHRLTLRVTSLPLAAVLRSYTDSAAVREVKGTVARRGLCGDVFLLGLPAGPALREVAIGTSVRRGELTIEAAMEGLDPAGRYRLEAQVKDGGESRGWRGPAFTAADLDAGGRFTWQEPWRPTRLWDTATPAQTSELSLALHDESGHVLDVHWPERFGFREFTIEGRDFLLNGTRLHLSAVPFDNAQVGAAWAGYAAARESFERLQSFGINFVYTHNYDCEPGAHLGFEEILRAADDVGMLVALSQPHFSHYAWAGADADRTNGYARHADFYTRVAGNHPSVVMYAMSHNATGYNEDMNPDLIDGVHAVRDTWAERNVRLANRAEGIVRRLDPSRLVYHHASGNLGPLHAINFYPNFVPIQELSDWFGHWAAEGVKPVFLCEYGAPFTWDWTMYRGWFRDQREFGSARVPWEFCVAEWNAQFVGDRAFPASPTEQANLRWEAQQFREGRLWHRWDYPADVGSSRFDERYPIIASYLTHNWRAFRTLGVSALSPWEYGHYWKLKPGVDRGRRELAVDWEHLQRPGFSADFLDQRYERMDLAYERSDWVPTPAAEALLRNNRPLLAYLASGPEALTARDHNHRPGDAIAKTVVLINDTRGSVTAEVEWSVNLPQPLRERRTTRIAPGSQDRLPVGFSLPPDLPPGPYRLQTRVRFDGGEVQEDDFRLDVLPGLDIEPAAGGRWAVFDPQGATLPLLEQAGIHAASVAPEDDLAAFDVLVVGRAALTSHGPGPDFRRVREGLKVIVLEQTAEALERRLGFRVAEYGLRQVFIRVPDHPVVAGLEEGHLRDWRGDATLQPARLQYEMRPRHGPTVRWCDLPVTRLWRCGNRGNVASVLIEKPACGDFLPILDGGYGLQYSPLLEYREGRGVVVFCQLDVTGRTTADPVAARLSRNLLRYISDWRPSPARRARYAGDPVGLARLREQGFLAVELAGASPAPDELLILGPGGGKGLSAAVAEPGAWLRAGGRILGFGMGAEDLAALPGPSWTARRHEHLSVDFASAGRASFRAGVGPAEVHLREPREVLAIDSKPLAQAEGLFAERDGIALCQIVPWSFDLRGTMNLRRTARSQARLFARLVANAGVAGTTPVLERFSRPVDPARAERRWLEGLYLDTPEEWDDPYRFFRW